MDKILAISDIHGQLDMLDALLSTWNSDSERLVFLGDYVDRGKDSYGVIHKVKNLVNDYGAIAIGGNHEQMFLDWLDDPEDHWFSKWLEDESSLNDNLFMQTSSSIFYYSNGGSKTINSFYGQDFKNSAYKYLPSRNANFIKNNFAEEIEFIRGLPDYFEHKDLVFVHAGVNLAYSDWKNSSTDDFRWIRKPFHYGINGTGKTFIFGHTPTRYLHKGENATNDNVWVSRCNTKIGIDGAAVFGGYLHGLLIDDETVHVRSVNKNLTIT